jgi:DNA ligase-1
MNQTLYKSTKSGATQQWSISTEGATFTCTFGQVDGKLQSQTTACEGRNIGRANETTPEQQAVLEAQALVTKKLKSGYSTSIACDSEVQLPMKVKSYQDQIKNITFPCYSEFKYNGINGLYRLDDDGKLTLYSRGGEVYPPLPHLEPTIHAILNELNRTELIGELYIHNTPLQDIQAAVTKPNDLSAKLSFIVFDIPGSPSMYRLRRNDLGVALHEVLRSNPVDSFKYVATPHSMLCKSTEDIEHHYNYAISRGYEGTVIKLLNGFYRYNVRSSEQFKYKKAKSAEFLIAGYELDKRSHPVFHLFTDSTQSKVFKAKPKGTHEFLSSIDPQTYIGQWATLEYETLSKDLVPLKPIFIGLRKCDSNGTPLE